MTKLQEQMALLKKLPATRVAYYGCLLVAIAIEFAFHVCAVAGKNWIEVEYEGNKTNHGLWVICSNNRCVRWDEIYLTLPGKLLSKPEACLKPRRTSATEFFCKNSVNSFKLLIIFPKSSIVHVRLVSKYTSDNTGAQQAGGYEDYVILSGFTPCCNLNVNVASWKAAVVPKLNPENFSKVSAQLFLRIPLDGCCGTVHFTTLV